MASRLRERNESAYVLVLFALSLTVLVLLIGIAIDLGSWYLKASKIQRASDLASLSGASALPDEAAARAAALDSLKRNGFTSGGQIEISIDVDASSVTVNTSDAKVPTYFLRPLFNDIKIGRKANAVKSSAIPLGNPFNVFGYGSNTGKSSRIGIIGGSPQGFWASINGWCTPKEDGDFFSARFDANKGANSHICNNNALSNTADGAPTNTTGPRAGYNYIVDVPANAGQVDLLVFDGQSNYRESGADDVNAELPGDDEGGMDTNFKVARINAEGTESQLFNKYFRDADPTQGVNGAGWDIWTRLATVGPGRYRINVTSWIPQRILQNNPNNPQSTAWNNFTLMASRQSAQFQMCDSRDQPLVCPRISGRGAVSVFANQSSGSAEFYLAEIPKGMSGQVEAYLWDPGEGTNTIELISPSGIAKTFTATEPTLAFTYTGTTLDVSGTAPKTKAGIQNDDKFNDRLVTLTFTPDPAVDYNSATNEWWKLRYTAGNGKVTDRTTWGVSAGVSSPVYLAKAP